MGYTANTFITALKNKISQLPESSSSQLRYILHEYHKCSHIDMHLTTHKPVLSLVNSNFQRKLFNCRCIDREINVFS